MERLQKDLDRLLQQSPSQLGRVSVVNQAFFDAIPGLYDTLQDDVTGIFEGDPAAKDRGQVIRAIGFLCHCCLSVCSSAAPSGGAGFTSYYHRICSQQDRVDIHPSAKIGSHFCIDHGTGIVIGETALIGNHVKIYQNVTLGALSVNKEDAAIKRHPTIEDNVIIYSGATILGGQTVIGHDSVIGGNVWLTRSIPSKSKIYYQSKMYNDVTSDTDLIIFKTS